MQWPLINDKAARQRALNLLLIVALSFVVRGLTAQFIGARLNDAGWFPYGIYGFFDRQAQDGLDGRASFFWINDPARTDAAIYPPGYPLWLAFIYGVTGTRSAAVVQQVQWVLDALSVLLVVGAGVTAFGWRTGIWAGWIAALWPLLALYGAIPLADAPTSWVVLGGAWMLLLAAKRQSFVYALMAGALVGASCWLRANALLLAVFWALALFLFVKAHWRRRASLAAGMCLGAALLITPVVVRNIITFNAFVPTGLGVGTNLWEGIGETERAQEFGAIYGDEQLIEHERKEMNVPEGAAFNLYYPDGVRRDRERTRKAMAVILGHPVWYTGVVLKRMIAVMKYAGEPNGIYGSAGFNVTAKKCLPVGWQGGVVAFFVNILGMIQSVLRYALLPLMLTGAFLAFRSERRLTALIMATVLYYLVVGSIMHTHIRYGLPMHALLTIFSGLALWRLKDAVTVYLQRKRELKAEG
jgi:hypothetical protein